MKEAARKLKTGIKGISIFQGLEDFKSKADQTFDDAKSRATQKIGEAKTRVRKAQSHGVTRIVQTQIKTDHWLRETANRFSHPRVAGVQNKILAFSDKWMALEIEDYNALNAKDAVRAIKELGLSDILRVQAYEMAHKNRKTVLKSINERLNKYEAGVV